MHGDLLLTFKILASILLVIIVGSMGVTLFNQSISGAERVYRLKISGTISVMIMIVVVLMMALS